MGPSEEMIIVVMYAIKGWFGQVFMWSYALMTHLQPSLSIKPRLPVSSGYLMVETSS